MPNERGSTAVETALVIPIIILVLVGSLELTAIARTQLQLVAAAREGARVAVTTPDEVQVTRAVRTALGTELGNRAGIQISRSLIGAPVRVRVKLKHRLVTPFWTEVNLGLSSQATMAAER